MRRLTFLATFLSLIPILCYSAPIDVKYSGFAFCGSYKDIPVNFKYTQTLLDSTKDENGHSIFDKEFYRFFNESKSNIKNFNLLLGEKTGSKIAMAIALTRENIVIDKLSDVYKITINLCCNVIFLNFEDMKVIASYPLYLEYTDAKREYPTEGHIVKRLKQLYFSEDFSILKLIKGRLDNLKLKDDVYLSMKIININIEDSAKEKLERYENNLGAFKSLVAQRFSDFLSDRLKVAVLPYAKDYLGARMSLVFSDATVQDFKIPPASYSIDFILRKFVKKEHQKTAVEDSYLYGVYATVKIYDPDLGTDYWDEKVKYGAVKAIPKSQTSIDDFSIFDEITGIVMVKAIKEMEKDKKLYKEVIQRCLNE